MAFSRFSARRAPLVPLSAALIVMQAVAAIYFLVDGIDDAVWATAGGLSPETVMEALVAAALLGGVVSSAVVLRRLLAEADRRDATLALLRGAFADRIARRFAEWKLSAAEAEVALFALKGCTIAEIADLRGAAGGTVRSQLSQVYAKAGVGSQSKLIALFIDDLFEDEVAG